MTKPNPIELLYTKDHQWVRDNGDGSVTCGITDYAQQLLTDVVFVELPSLGKQLERGQEAAVLESVKSVSDVLAPLSGEVIEVNRELENQPEYINQDAFGLGWIMRIKLSDPTQLTALLDAAAYEAMINL